MHDENIFTRAAKILYGSKTKEEKEKKNLRNSLISELGDSIETKHVLYSPTTELKKMRDEKKSQFVSLDDIKEFENNSNRKAKLLDKIPVKKENEVNLNSKSDEDYEATPLKAYLSYEEDNPQPSEIQDKRFNSIMKHIYNTEGGFVDDPDDAGGRTNKGVTQRTFNDYNKKHRLPLKDVKDIT